jgi:RNA recognition motif-containing protein
MAKKIYVGNLSYGTTEDSLRSLFSAHGEVESVAVIVDRDSGRSKGFGFIEMRDEDAAKAAISALDGQELDGRRIRVNEANEKPRRDAPRW